MACLGLPVQAEMEVYQAKPVAPYRSTTPEVHQADTITPYEGATNWFTVGKVK
jgi:hypothetical protein